MHDFASGLDVDLGYGRSSAWSPDGTKIAFTSTSAETNYLDQLYTMNPHGLEVTLLHDFPGTYDYNIRSISWSPDGKKIAFDVEQFVDGDNDIYIIDADGANLKNITNTADIYESSPIWIR